MRYKLLLDAFSEITLRILCFIFLASDSAGLLWGSEEIHAIHSNLRDFSVINMLVTF